MLFRLFPLNFCKIACIICNQLINYFNKNITAGTAHERALATAQYNTEIKTSEKTRRRDVINPRCCMIEMYC